MSLKSCLYFLLRAYLNLAPSFEWEIVNTLDSIQFTVEKAESHTCVVSWFQKDLKVFQ